MRVVTRRARVDISYDTPAPPMTHTCTWDRTDSSIDAILDGSVVMVMRERMMKWLMMMMMMVHHFQHYHHY